MPPVLNQPPGEVAWMRIASSSHPEAFRTWMARTLTALDRSEDLAAAPWSAEDPIRAAAEIEALAAMRRLNVFREDPK